MAQATPQARRSIEAALTETFGRGAQEEEEPLPDAYDAARIIEVGVKIGLDQYHFGSCGPAAVAINRVLFRGGGKYVVARCKRRWSGHVAVLHAGSLFDYIGLCDYNSMAGYADDPLIIETGVPEKVVKTRFCKGHTLCVDHAVAILLRAWDLVTYYDRLTEIPSRAMARARRDLRDRFRRAPR